MIFHIQLPRRPQELEIRDIKRFAFLPVRIDSETVVWLRTYYERQRYESSDYRLFVWPDSRPFLVASNPFATAFPVGWKCKCRAASREQLDLDEVDKYLLANPEKRPQ